VRTQEDLPGRFFFSRPAGVLDDAGRAPEVVDEAMLLGLAVLLIRDTEDRGWVNGHECPVARRRCEGLAPARADGDAALED
jgi:hypothetical protein